MAYQFTDISQLDPKVLQQNEQFVVSFLQSTYPDLDFSPGSVLRETVIRPAAIVYTLDQNNIALYQNSNSLLTVTQNPSLADANTVANILSNFQISASSGTYATGTVAMTFSAPGLIVIQTGMTFTAGGVTFSPSATVVGLPPGSTPTSPQDQVLVAGSSGSYTLQIPVTASTAGSVAVGTGTVFTVNPAPPNLESAYAVSDFLSGSDASTNQSLINQLLAGITPRVAGSRLSTRLLLQTQFPYITDVSIIGAGDPEMLRDAENLRGLHTGGKADIYARTALYPTLTTLTMTAYLQNPDLGYFSLSFPRSTLPGFYGVVSINPSTAVVATGSLPIISDVRSIDSTAVPGVDLIPVMNAADGAFTRYQTATITFQDTSSAFAEQAVGTAGEYTVVVLGMPNLDVISDYMLSRSVRPPGLDLLVKAPIPCMVRVGIVISQGASDPAPNVAAVISAVVAAVNGVTFSNGQLPGSLIVDAAQNVLTGSTVVQTPLDLRGAIRYPDQTSAYLLNANTLAVPLNSAEMSSSRTTAFFLRPSDVIVTVVPSTSLPV